MREAMTAAGGDARHLVLDSAMGHGGVPVRGRRPGTADLRLPRRAGTMTDRDRPPTTAARLPRGSGTRCAATSTGWRSGPRWRRCTSGARWPCWPRGTGRSSRRCGRGWHASPGFLTSRCACWPTRAGSPQGEPGTDQLTIAPTARGQIVMTQLAGPTRRAVGFLPQAGSTLSDPRRATTRVLASWRDRLISGRELPTDCADPAGIEVARQHLAGHVGSDHGRVVRHRFAAGRCTTLSADPYRPFRGEAMRRGRDPGHPGLGRPTANRPATPRRAHRSPVARRSTGTR